MKNTCAAILAGGMGMRLQRVLEGTPKVLARVVNRPFVAILLDHLESAGIEKVVMLTGFCAAQVHNALGDRHGAMSLDYSAEPIPLGTAGALRHGLAHLSEETILLMNGDSYCGVNLDELISAHHRRQADASLTLSHVADTGRYGRIDLNAEEKLTRFAEKQESGGPGWINAGVYVLRRSIIEELPSGQFISLERDLLPAWVQCRSVFGFRNDGPFLDIGTPQSYAFADEFFGSIRPGLHRNHDRLIEG
jgi:D-glycero-alpha-D-manno-heptose 1-phosphate guanylyltransferase